MVNCDKHGLCFIGHCCVHIAHSIDVRQQLVAKVVIDGWNNPVVVCSSCLRFAESTIAKWRHANSNERYDVLEPSHATARCGDCISDWFAETGQGRLEDIIEEGRRGVVR